MSSHVQRGLGIPPTASWRALHNQSRSLRWRDSNGATPHGKVARQRHCFDPSWQAENEEVTAGIGCHTLARAIASELCPICVLARSHSLVKFSTRFRRDGQFPRITHSQSTATSSAAQTSRILESARRPILSTRTPTATLSIESRFTAERRGTGSSPGSSTTSLGSPRIVVVQGATRVRRNRGIAASRDSTTTGLRPISGSSHHQTSPRDGNGLMKRRPPDGRNPRRPTRPAL